MFTFVTSCCSPHICTSQQKSSTECLIWCQSGCVRILPFDRLRGLCHSTVSMRLGVNAHALIKTATNYGYSMKRIFSNTPYHIMQRTLRRLCFHRCLSVRRGVCVTGRCAWMGIMHGGGVHGRGHVCHCSGQYTSYWNAFLLLLLM